MIVSVCLSLTARQTEPGFGVNMKKLDVALSFAGENRAFVEAVAECLKQHRVRCFYDRAEPAALWGKDLYQYLADVYENCARYCVIFVSEHYVEKRWTNHELRSAQARALREPREYILPARFDDTVLPGLPDTVGYIDLRNMTPEAFASVIMDKVRTLSDRRDSLETGLKDLPGAAAEQSMPDAADSQEPSPNAAERLNPLSPSDLRRSAAAVTEVKRLLSEDRLRIDLSDYVLQEAKRTALLIHEHQAEWLRSGTSVASS